MIKCKKKVSTPVTLVVAIFFCFHHFEDNQKQQPESASTKLTRVWLIYTCAMLIRSALWRFRDGLWRFAYCGRTVGGQENLQWRWPTGFYDQNMEGLAFIRSREGRKKMLVTFLFLPSYYDLRCQNNNIGVVGGFKHSFFCQAPYIVCWR